MDEDEIARFLQGVYPGLVAGLDARTNGHVAAEDAVQEALVRAWERAARGEPVDALSGWVARVAANLLHDGWRRVQAEERDLARLVLQRPGLCEGFLATAPPAAAETEILTELVAALPRGQRGVVVLHYYADLPVRDVARRLGVSEGTVKRSLFRARRALARALAGDPAWVAGIDRMITIRRSTVKGWYMAGSHPRDYAHGIASDELHDGKRVAFVRSTAKETAGFGTLMQMVAAGEYLGQRLRFSAALRTAGVDGWVGLWMRVDGPESGRSLAFDNMQGRSIVGTTDWRRYEVVLDVAEEARAIGLGVLLHGAGELCVADFRFEPVAKDVPTTGPAHPARPQNLDLSED